MKFLGHRIADKRVLRYVKRFLIAGIMEDGAVSASDKGTPQGGIVSPILANIYLHYSLDLWFTRVFQKGCYGQSRMIRYADDFVVCFQREVDAIRFRHELDERLSRFGLEISPGKDQDHRIWSVCGSQGKEAWWQGGNLRFSRIYPLLWSDKKRQAVSDEAGNFA